MPVLSGPHHFPQLPNGIDDHDDDEEIVANLLNAGALKDPPKPEPKKNMP